MKRETLELLPSRDFRLISDRADDPQQEQAERDNARQIMEQMQRAQLALPMGEEGER